MQLAPGTRLGAYEIVGLVGAGGMGEVFRAVDARLDRHVALKVLPEAVASDPERTARFQREAKVLASLNHPNIATIHGLEHANGSTVCPGSGPVNEAETQSHGRRLGANRGLRAAVSELSAFRQDRVAMSESEMKPNAVKSRFSSHGGLTPF